MLFRVGAQSPGRLPACGTMPALLSPKGLGSYKKHEPLGIEKLQTTWIQLWIHNKKKISEKR